MAQAKRSGSQGSGVLVREFNTGSLALAKGIGKSVSVVRMPDGKVMKVVDRELFERAVRAAKPTTSKK